MMDAINNVIIEFLKTPFAWGLIIGLGVALFVWIKGTINSRTIKAEVKKLRDHLHTKMEIDAEGHKTREDELGKLKKQNENLRITVKTLQQKPGRAELRLLHVYDKAIHSMLAKAPGFAATWEMVLQEAEDEIQQTDSGVSAFVRKVFVTQKAPGVESQTPDLIEYNKDDETD